MTSRQRVLATLNHQEPDRIPLFGPNIIRTHDPYDRQLREFLDTFEFDDLAHLPGLVDPPNRLREQPDQTFVDGGLLVVPVGAPDEQVLTVVQRQGDRTIEKPSIACRFVKLIGKEGWG